MDIVPLYDPGGLEAELPTVNVPPIFTCVRAGCIAVVENGDAGCELPIATETEPPLLPVSVAAGPFNIEIIVPGGASISNIDG
jgi:hypothetical protein